LALNQIAHGRCISAPAALTFDGLRVQGICYRGQGPAVLAHPEDFANDFGLVLYLDQSPLNGIETKRRGRIEPPFAFLCAKAILVRSPIWSGMVPN
jgi:hypothetical protein